MLGSLWNRLTKFSVLGIIAAVVSVALGYTSWLNEALAQYFAVFAIILFITSIFIEGYGVYEARHFFREDAQEVYKSVTQLIMKLRGLAAILHEDHDDKPECSRRYTGDERYKKLMSEFAQVKLKCGNSGLLKKLSNLIENEKRLAKYRINPDKHKFSGALDSVDRDIRNYINTRLRSREELKTVK